MRELALHTLAPAKINLGLFLGQVREDGKHELATVMQSISLADELTLEWAPAQAGEDEVLCPGVSGENLAAAALRAFRQATGWDAPPLRLTISKHVPVAAGLGGGSADAAAALRLASHASGRGERGLLEELAARLGADVPAALKPGRWLATGAGERLVALPDPNPSFGVLVMPLAAELSTRAVYAEADRLGLAREPRDLRARREGLEAALNFGVSVPPQELLSNDLAMAARSLCPAMDGALERVGEAGADAVLVSGSGPTVVGLFLRANGRARVARAIADLAGDRRSGGEREPISATPVSSDFAGVVDRSAHATQ